jgi:hypothetical protein
MRTILETLCEAPGMPEFDILLALHGEERAEFRHMLPTAVTVVAEY